MENDEKRKEQDKRAFQENSEEAKGKEKKEKGEEKEKTDEKPTKQEEPDFKPSGILAKFTNSVKYIHLKLFNVFKKYFHNIVVPF